MKQVKINKNGAESSKLAVKVGIKTKIKKLMVMLAGFVFMLISQVQYVCAATYGENIASYLTEQIFAIATVVLIIVLVGCVAKRSFVGAFTTIIGGGIILYFIKDPQKAADIGTSIANLVFK